MGSAGSSATARNPASPAISKPREFPRTASFLRSDRRKFDRTPDTRSSRKRSAIGATEALAGFHAKTQTTTLRAVPERKDARKKKIKISFFVFFASPDFSLRLCVKRLRVPRETL